MEGRVLGVLGGRDVPPALFNLWASRSTFIVAADSGADLTLEAGFMPDAIIGDMDSIKGPPDRYRSEFVKIEDQNLSDCDKLLDWINERGAREIVLIGVEGDRFDHVFATIGSCLRSPLAARIATRDGVGDIFMAGTYTLRTAPNSRVTLIPLAECLRVDLEGVAWELKGAHLVLGNRVSLSNVAVQQQVRLSFEGGAMLVCRQIVDQNALLWPSEDTV